MSQLTINWANKTVIQGINESVTPRFNESIANKSTSHEKVIHWGNEPGPKMLRSHRFFALFLRKPAPGFANLILYKCFNPLNFFCDFVMQIELSLQSGRRFADLILQILH